MAEENLNVHEGINLTHEEVEQIFRKQRDFSERMSLEAKRQELRDKQFKLVIISIALAVVTGATTLVASQIVGLNKSKPLDAIFSFGASKEMFASKSDLDSIKIANEGLKDAIKRAFEDAKKGQGNELSANLEISVISAKLAEIDRRLATMEKSISSDPEKALSIPMLRKDQDNLSKTFDTNRVAVAAELARVNDLQKWILGGIGTVLVTLIAGLFTSLFTVLSKGRAER
ncbi:hypothetical protein [Pseudomonas putida]|uniref:hypothetical protein n=1 Tax=Pseudomonas putida TaxID=303 RepID=UPI002119507F|nr:hypothetical protein [Pseudomonas putida]